MSDDNYYWCQLKNGNSRTCGYIEARGAKVGSKVELVDINVDGLWDVISVGKSISKEDMRSSERLFSKWRKVTDV